MPVRIKYHYISISCGLILVVFSAQHARIHGHEYTRNDRVRGVVESHGVG